MTLEIDHKYKDEVVCPYCGHEYSDSWELSESSVEECGECGKKFSFERYTEVTYTSIKLCKENGEKHDWGKPTKPHICSYNRGYISGKHCRVCGACELVPVDPKTGEFLEKEVVK